MPLKDLKELPTAEELLSKMFSLDRLEELYVEFMNRIITNIVISAEKNNRITYVSGVLVNEKVTKRILEELKAKGYKTNDNVYSADKVRILEIKW